MRHVGIRPLHSLTLLDFKKKLYYELYPDGQTERIWTLRMLSSGCGQLLQGKAYEMRECIYCPHCDEWFSKEQWKEE